MLRYAATAYLVVVIAAGPWACCCTLTRLATSLTALKKPAVERASEGPPPCCHSSSKPARPTHEQGGQPRKPTSPADPDCPCKQGSAGDVVALPVSDHQAADLLQGRSLAPDALASVALPPDALFGPFEKDRSLLAWGVRSPFLSKDDILRVLHILRC